MNSWMFSKSSRSLGNFARVCEHVKFIVHSPKTEPFESKFCNNQTLLDACDTQGNYTFIVPQWLGGDKIIWKDRLISTFMNATNNCVVFVDYSYYTQKSFNELLALKGNLTTFIARKLRYFEELGFNPDNGILFGFDIGAHFVLEAGIKYGVKKIGRIDCCEPRTNGFTSSDPSMAQTADAAKHVQCMHTSEDFGTADRFCPHDVNLGVCGRSQPEDIFTWAGNDIKCIEYYVASFKYDFNLVTQAAVEQKYSTTCVPKKQVPDVSTYDPPKKFGWQFDFTLSEGEFYCIPNATASAEIEDGL
ncbi:uncharacterized protein LOC134837237 [Culicoides brevitarsis]|uniref:uncharacterized protein LOC134837237 n=1 Tax=Culicoides brevitarsis TaxID=469753 RepID=UPI00307C023E